MISTHALTLRLHWGHDASREIEVPVEVRKGSYSGRYELYVDSIHVGWVVKFGSKWESYITAEQDGYRNHVAGIARTRTEAIDWLVYELGKSARTNVLAARAKIAYGE